MEIVFPVLILTVIAIVFGIAIAYCSKKFAVKEDPRIESVNDLLAGANCGACGKAGCADFAKAVVEGTAKLGDCSVTSKENKEKIPAILYKSEEIWYNKTKYRSFGAVSKGLKEGER